VLKSRESLIQVIRANGFVRFIMIFNYLGLFRNLKKCAYFHTAGTFWISKSFRSIHLFIQFKCLA